MNIDASSQDAPSNDDAARDAHPEAQSREAAAAPRIDPRGLLARLQALSPTFRDFKPVALRIDKAIAEQFPEVERKVVRAAMRLHTGSTRYLKALEKGTHRYDLLGNEDGELSDEHRAHAAQTLKERFADAARRKREQAQEEAARKRAAEAEQRKAEKMQQLVSKFSK